MNSFQIGLMVVFIIMTLVGVLMFAGVIPTPGGGGSSRTEVVDIVLWGTLPRTEVVKAVQNFNKNHDATHRISYFEKDAESLELDLLRAISDNTIPDLILFPHEYLFAIEDELMPIPETNMSERTFRELYIEGSEIFFDIGGAKALPVLVDPIVLYWNRDIFNNEKITEPPNTWSNVLSLAYTITKRDSRGKILFSAIPLGESSNITHAKDIISLLIMQSGDAIVARDTRTGGVRVSLNNDNLGGTRRGSAETALEYYISFADPVKSNYTWNGSLQSSTDAFAEGSSALYIGRASDFNVIKDKNPHLNFDIAPVPQLEGGLRELTYGSMYAIGIPNNSRKKTDAFKALTYFAINDEDVLNDLSVGAYLSPAKRKLLAGEDIDPTLDIFKKEAIIARGWIDPNPKVTTSIFRRMVEDVLSRRVNSSSALSDAAAQLSNAVK